MDYELARMNMVENQIRANRVTDIKIIEAFKEVPRENFVPSSLKEVSYNDEDIPFDRLTDTTQTAITNITNEEDDGKTLRYKGRG